MKVKELIKELQKLDSEAEIGTAYEDYREEYYDYFVCDEMQVLSKSKYDSIMKMRKFEEDKECSNKVDYVIC